MPFLKLSSTDAFIISDLPDAPASGVVRMARKILTSSATDLARSATYTFATFEMERSGASGGINAEGDATDEALANFLTEIEPKVGSGDYHLDPAKGIPEGGFAPLLAADGRNPLAGTDQATVATVLAATKQILGDIDGRSIAIEGSGSIPDALAAAVTNAGGNIVNVEGVDKKPWMIWGAKADAILCGSKLGALTHQGTEFVKAKAIVPWGPIPVTTKAFAQLKRAGVIVAPDFVSASGGLLAGYEDGDEAAVLASLDSKVTAVLDQLGSHDDGLFLAACYQAEAFLGSWSERPFGRPLAA